MTEDFNLPFIGTIEWFHVVFSQYCFPFIVVISYLFNRIMLAQRIQVNDQATHL